MKFAVRVQQPLRYVIMAIIMATYIKLNPNKKFNCAHKPRIKFIPKQIICTGDIWLYITDWGLYPEGPPDNIVFSNLGRVAHFILVFKIWVKKMLSEM